MPNEITGVEVTRHDPQMQARVADELGVYWWSPTEPPMQLAGFPWFAEDAVYERVPRRAHAQLREPVVELAQCTAGGQLRFQTDSSRLIVRATLLGPAGMVHMPATGQCGFDCYLGPPDDHRFLAATKYPLPDTQYTIALVTDAPRAMRNVTLNFPLYQGVTRVQIGLDADARVLPPPPYADARRVIFYGTSITQGGCACRPGMAYPNILSRRLQRECINLGLSGNGRGEPELAQLLAEIPHPGLFVLDYEANTPSSEDYRRTLPDFIGILRAAHPAIPILVVSQIRFAREAAFPGAAIERLERRAFARSLVEDLRARGDASVAFLDGESLLPASCWDECTVDGIHPTDLGFLAMADQMEPVIRHMLAQA